MKLLKIDEIVIDEHYYLCLSDTCFYLANYTSGVGYESNNPINSLILNFKKGLERKGKSDWRHKQKAIDTISEKIRTIILEKVNLDDAILVPIPPSKAKGHILYDDRMTKTLQKASSGVNNCDIRELIVRNTSSSATHKDGNRLPPDKLKDYLDLDLSVTKNMKSYVILFDDVLTTGSHFKACKSLIIEQYPDVKVLGIFIARVDRNLTDDF